MDSKLTMGRPPKTKTDTSSVIALESPTEEQVSHPPLPADSITPSEAVSHLPIVTPLRAGMKLFTRDKFGLLPEITYVFDENGYVNWRKMVPIQFLYINSDIKNKERIEKKYNKNIKDIDISTDNVEDRDLIITLAGLKYLLRLRGYSSVVFSTKEASDQYASVNCYIDFIGNFETNGFSQSYSENGSAHLRSTDSFMRAYLVEAATNRAFARCIRNYLNINIVSKEELFDQSKVEAMGDGSNGGDNKTITNGSAHTILENKCAEKGLSFTDVRKAACVNYKVILDSNPELWNKWSDLSAQDCYVLLGKIKEKKG